MAASENGGVIYTSAQNAAVPQDGDAVLQAFLARSSLKTRGFEMNLPLKHH